MGTNTQDKEAGPSTFEGRIAKLRTFCPAVLQLLGRTIFIDGDVILRVKRGEKLGTMFAFYVSSSMSSTASCLM